MIVRSDRHMSAVAKAAVLCHSMSAVASALNELSKLSYALGQEPLGREADVIADMFLQRRKAFLVISRQAGKSLILEKVKGS